ncbi:SRPBCC family protein [Streptomyces sp. NPDC053493]|uniref:SRPBCC family protein n=1 Tax=Streptomyces sp. NPDC053493 TaxID=3365705 RepID=UPI0037D08D80
MIPDDPTTSSGPTTPSGPAAASHPAHPSGPGSDLHSGSGSDSRHGLDDVRRLRAMAAGVRGARLVEGVVPAPLADVWAVMGDLEGEFGRFQPDMRRVRVLRTDGDRVEALAVSRYGLRAHFHGVLRPGWCWLQSRFLIIGMAAVPAPDGTLVALTGGVRLPGRAALVPFGARGELHRALRRLDDRVRERGPVRR